MIIKIFITAFIAFVLTRVINRYRRQELTFIQAGSWVIFWALVLAASLWPKTTDIFAKLVGIGRGADLLIFASIIALFFLIFRIIVRQEKINRDITRIVRKMTLNEEKVNKINSSENPDLDI